MPKSKEPEYFVWKGMISRCTNPNNTKYHHYGGRGITFHLCFAKYEDFVSWLRANDMYPKPDGMSFDRINVNGNYEPGNVRWSTYTEQNRNARSNRLIEYNGETKCLTEWAELFGILTKTLYTRLITRNWPVQRAMTQPVQFKR